MSKPAISPIYGSDIRRLVDRAFSAAGDLPRGVPPGGTIAERLGRWPVQRSGSFVLQNAAAPLQEAAGVTLLDDAAYWVRALPQRLIILGPLTEIACADIPSDDKLRTERRLIRAYHRKYLRVPLPAEILDLLTSCAGEAGCSDLIEWVDGARTVIMAATGLEAAIAARAQLRRHALLQGAAGHWTERCVSAAELMTDVLVICNAAHADLSAAMRAAAGGSVAEILADMPEERSVFESALPLMIRRTLQEEAFNEGERRLVLEFARSRQSPRGPILPWGTDTTEVADESPTGPPQTHIVSVRSDAIKGRPSSPRASRRWRMRGPAGVTVRSTRSFGVKGGV